MHGRAAGYDDPWPIVVVVVSCNTRDLLDRCLESLRPEAEAGHAEVWVVDNASADGSAAMVSQSHPWASLVDLSENVGYGPAVNLIASRTSSRWLAFSNADVALQPGALERLIAAGEADSGAGIIAPRLILPTGETQHLAWAFPGILMSLAQNVGPRLLPRRLSDHLALDRAWDPERPRRIPWAVGAFLLVRRSAWDQVGGFDPAQWMSAEDLDLGWRMHRAGWATRYEPTALVHHEESAATRRVWGKDLGLRWQRTAYGWMVRRMGRPRTSLIGLINFVGSGSRLLLWAALPRFRGEKRLVDLAGWTMVHLYAFAPRRRLDRCR